MPNANLSMIYGAGNLNLFHHVRLYHCEESIAYNPRLSHCRIIRGYHIASLRVPIIIAVLRGRKDKLSSKGK